MSKLIDINGLRRFLEQFWSAFAQKSIEKQAEMIYTAVSTDGVVYTATVPGVTELYSGLRITVKFNKTSTSIVPTLNVNGLGAKGIRQPLALNSSTTTTAAIAGWLNTTCPVILTYTGTVWKVDFARPAAQSLYGDVPIDCGGTGASTAEDALTNLGAASLTYVNQKIAELQAQIDALK